MEIIRMVENSSLGVKRTLDQLGINRSTFYLWYRRYTEDGYDGLADRSSSPRRFWNQIPPEARRKVVEIALEHTEKSPRELAFYITDKRGYFISESSVYRILKANDLITSPQFMVLSAKDKFDNPTKGINELWQTDFTWLKVIQWGWYYLSTVMDDYSRFILAWRLCKGMSTDEVKETVEDAIARTGVDHVQIWQRPKLLTDNGPCFISGEFGEYLEDKGIKHTRGRPYHPMTQGKIERYHRSMKNVILLDNYYTPRDLEDEIGRFVEHYNWRRYHESLDNVTPADVYLGKRREILARRERIKRETMKKRRIYNRNRALAS